MKKIKLNLNESLVTNINSNQVDVIEDISTQPKPDYQIIDITVIPDEEYNPTIQSILIDLDESNRLCESEEESKNLSINILSETVNIKTGYSNSLFEFENTNHTITLSLVLQETERNGIYKVEAYTTKGEKVFESNTYKPKKLIESYLNSLANEYLIDKKLNESFWNDSGEKEYKGVKISVEKSDKGQTCYIPLRDVNFKPENGIQFFSWKETKEYIDKKLNEAEDPIKDDVKEDLGIEPGSDEEAQLDDLYYDEEVKDYGDEDTPAEDSEDIKAPEDYSVEEFMKAMKLTDEIKSLNIDYSEWNDMSQEERDKLVTPELNRFYNKYKVDFEKDPKVFNLLQYNLTDDNFHTEARILRDLKGGE